MNFMSHFSKCNIINNKKLIEYLELCKNNRYVSKIKFMNELHHILPQSIFPEYKDLRKYPMNGVYLSYSDHLYAHQLLAESIGGNMVYAWNLMSNMINHNHKYKIDISSYIKIKQELVKFSTENMKKIGSNSEYIQKRVETRKNNGGYILSNETRKKMSDAKIGKTLLISTRKKISDANKGKPKSKEHNRKVSESLTGRKHTINTRKKISDTNRGKLSGSLNPSANKITIFNEIGDVVFRCDGNFFKICKDNGLPKALMNSYKNNGIPIYTGNNMRHDIMAKYGKFRGWYAIKHI